MNVLIRLFPIFLYLIYSSFACKSANNSEKREDAEDNKSDTVLSFEKLSWKDIDSLQVEYYFDENYGDYLGKPKFSDKFKVWDGKNVIIEGYWIPVSELGDSSVAVLSKFPFAQCYFCSGAGIETVMQIKPISKIKRLDADEKVTLKGTFKLNGENPMELFYQLEKATLN